MLDKPPPPTWSPGSSISSLTSSSSVYSSDVKICSNPTFYGPSSMIREIMKGDVEAVVVSHVNSPSDFHLQLVVNHQLLETVLNMVQTFVLSDSNTVESIDLGKL